MCSEPLHPGDQSGFHLQCVQEETDSYKSKNEEFGASRQPSFLTHCVCEQMCYLQVIRVGWVTAVPVCASSVCPIPPELQLNTSFQVLMGASCLLQLDELCLLRLFVYQRRSAINRNDWFCWGLFLDIKNAPSSPGWLSFQQPMQTEPNPQQRI